MPRRMTRRGSGRVHGSVGTQEGCRGLSVLSDASFRYSSCKVHGVGWKDDISPHLNKIAQGKFKVPDLKKPIGTTSRGPLRALANHGERGHFKRRTYVSFCTLGERLIDSC
jgi:hypothetical protein